MEIKARKNIARPFPDRLQRQPRAVKAHELACLVHEGQIRKNGADFIDHPEAVAEYTDRILPGDEVAIAAAFLHDTVEDGEMQLDDLSRMFGPEVAHIVNMLTEQDRQAPWIYRKMEAIRRIGEMDLRSVVVKTADRLHNDICLLASLEEDGIGIMERFNGSLDQQIRIAQLANAALRSRYEDLQALDKDGLLRELEEVTERLAKWAREHGVALEPAYTQFLRLQDCVGEPDMV